nr:M protein [Eptesicus bat coronavirus]
MATNISSDVIVEHLKNWNFTWNIILTVLLMALQYGHMKYSFLLYGLKMAILWLLWPLVFVLSCFNIWANVNTNWYYVAFSIAMLVITLVLWIMYFVNSFRLYRRAPTFWAFNPETDCIIVLNVLGNQRFIPTIVAPTGITLTLLSGTLLCDGIRVATGVTNEMLPSVITVAKPTTTIIYERKSKSVSKSTNTGWAFYARAQHGDYSAVSNSAGPLSDRDKLLHIA